MAQISYYGKLADAIGTPDEQIDIPPEVGTAGELRAWLGAKNGGYGDLMDERIKIAADNMFVDDDAAISGAQEIAFMPPVGGG